MKTILLFLIFFAFLQSAFLPVNLVLVVIIARSLITQSRDNLFLAFFGGLILSFLTQVNLGYYPIVFILVVKLAGMFKKLPVSFNVLPILLSGSLIITLVTIANNFFISQNLSIYPHLVEAILVLPVYWLIKIWEGRFVAKSHMKLKVR
jgi:hypothetical protein